MRRFGAITRYHHIWDTRLCMNRGDSSDYDTLRVGL